MTRRSSHARLRGADVPGYCPDCRASCWRERSGADPPGENDPRSVARRPLSPTTTPNGSWRSPPPETSGSAPKCASRPLLQRPPARGRPCLTSGPTFVTLRPWKRTLSASDSGPTPRRAKSDFLSVGRERLRLDRLSATVRPRDVEVDEATTDPFAGESPIQVSLASASVHGRIALGSTVTSAGADPPSGIGQVCAQETNQCTVRSLDHAAIGRA